MRRSGRARTQTSTSVFPPLLLIFVCITFVTSSEYGVPIEIKVWDAGRTPLAHMVDVTNGFGLKVLAEHNFLNDNNIAFSPYGLMGILVALYEGVDGESSYQIQRAMQLPWNRNVMRIGFRDIHRTLKTYFVPEEGFLAGLALNNENVTFNDSYKNILRFYGFDLDNDQLPTMPPQGNSTNGTTTAAPTINPDSYDGTIMITSTLSTMPSMESSTTAVPEIDLREEMTPNSGTVTITPTSIPTPGLSSAANVDTTSEISLATTNSLEQSQGESQPTSTVAESTVASTQLEPITTTTTALPISPVLTTMTSQSPSEAADEMIPPPSTIPDVETFSTQISQATAALTSDPAFDAETIDQQTSQATVALKNESTLNNDVDSSSTVEIVSSTAIPITTETSTFTTLNESTGSSTSTASNILVVETSETTSDNTASSQLAISSQMTSTETERSTMQTTAMNDNAVSTTLTISTAPTSLGTEISTETLLTGNPITDNTPISTTSTSADTTATSTDVMTTLTSSDSSTTIITESNIETLQRRKKSIVDFIFTNPPYLEDYIYYRSYDFPPILPSTNLDDKMFLANGLKSVQVSYMRYDTVLEYAYLPHLEASALRLPLDSDRYYLLVVLPRRGGGRELGRLLARMARESDLSDVYNTLRPRRVKGLVPSFTVKGHVTLTTDLQKLGIRDVFEPRQRDFTPMTRQSGVYVRSIEQAVSVAIRKYRPDERKKNRYVTNREPVKFYATYPFLYFVMDSSIHVSLMAGKMVDPLNSRIL